MTISELVELFASYPPDTEVGVLAVSPQGVVIDIAAADAVSIDATINDLGRHQRLWIIGVGESSTPAPTLISWPCSCGEIVTVHEHDEWPGEHVRHLANDTGVDS